MERLRIEKNKREQKRVKLQCKAFKELQELLPNSNQKKPWTKTQILQDASLYIRYLKLKLHNLEEMRTEDSSDDCQARPSCLFAYKVRSRVLYILSDEQLELFNFHVCRIQCLKFSQTLKCVSCLRTAPLPALMCL